MKPEFAGHDKLRASFSRVTVRRGTLMPVVERFTVLLAVFGSVWLAETTAVLVINPIDCGLVTRVNVAEPPLGNAPTIQVKVFCTLLQVPTDGVAETTARPGAI